MRVLSRILVLVVAIPLLGMAALGVRYHATQEKDRGQIDEIVGDSVRQFTGAEFDKDGRDIGSVVVRFAKRFEHPFAHFALLGAGGLFLIYGVWPRRREEKPEKAKRENTGEGVAEPGLSKKDQKRLLKAAKQIEAEQGVEESGNFMIGEGLQDEACDLFLANDLVERAAEVRHDQNRFDEAAELFSKAERWESAGAIYAQVERYEEAARCYVKADKRSVAGEMFERAENWKEAGECFAEIGFHRHASQAFMKCGAEARAAESLVQAFEDEGAGKSGSEDKQRELRGLAKKAGELLVKLERFDEAEAILVRAGAHGPAAKVAFHQGAYDRAAELFLRVGRGDLAAKALDKLGDEVGAARARGNYLRDKGEDETAIEELERAGELQDAGDLCRKLERYEDAGRLYMEVKDYPGAAEMFGAAANWPRAAEAYERAGAFDQAAEAYGRSGDSLKQAEMYEKAGDLFLAGKAFADHDQHDDAIRVLQQVPQDDPRFGEACSVLGALFSAKGQHGLSIKKFEEAIGDGAVSKSNVDAFFEFGHAHEKKGDYRQAAEIYEKILSFDYHYRDVGVRLERMKELMKVQTSPGGSSSPGSDTARDDRYQVKSELGRGGMGVVYLARDTVLERDVAYKVLPEQLRGNANALQNFLREAKAAAQLNHPNIVTVFDAGESEHGYYLAMELVEGTTLKEIVQRRGAISPGGVIYILRQMAEALSYAHSKKVVHRDIKTANTMWTPDKQVKIMDFGLAKLMEEVRNATTVVSGTPFYMSPEQTLGRNIDHRTDIYSLGVTVFELATGELPFRRGNVPYHHVHTPPPDPRSVSDKLPQALAMIILRCLEKSPESRYANAKEILEELDRLSGKTQG